MFGLAGQIAQSESTRATLESALPGSKPTLGPKKKKEAQSTESEPGIADSYVLWFLM